MRSRISETQRLLQETFAKVQGISELLLRLGLELEKEQFAGKTEPGKIKIDQRFREAANDLGYDVTDGRSLLEVFLLGNSVDKTELFYQTLYDDYLVKGEVEDDRFKADDEDLQPYFDALKNDINRPPFERFFRSRGLKPNCIYPPHYDKLKQKDENKELKCEQWEWSARKVGSKGKKMSLVTITRNFERKILLEFGFNYADFLKNPKDFDPEELQRTAGKLNDLLSKESNLLQKDIEDLFMKPTLAMIQQEVGENKGVEFAQVGRSTISTLDGVETKINTSSTSGFQIPQSQDLGQLLERAQKLQKLIGDFIPTETLPGASEASEIVTAGPLPSSQVIALAVAALEQNAIPAEIQTGTNLTFTPGIARNLNSAELNINLTVVDPTVTPTAEEKNVPPISRIGKQEMQTTVYTQALDFFDLSTFTSQATLDGGRFRIPIIGNLWNAIFGAIPVFGDLFSVSKGNQNVLHDSLILTNSFITPTSLSFGDLYAPANGNDKFDFCQEREKLLNYLQTLEPAGQASRRDTKIISNRESCLPKK